MTFCWWGLLGMAIEVPGGPAVVGSPWGGPWRCLVALLLWGPLGLAIEVPDGPAVAGTPWGWPWGCLTANREDVF